MRFRWILFVIVIVVIIALIVWFTRPTIRGKLSFRNECSFPIMVGSLGNPINPNNGGWVMNPGDTTEVNVPQGWQGRFWGRTGCDSSGKCVTGDCGGKIECDGAGGNPPATLIEFKLNGVNNLDFYDISLVDGFNLPASIYSSCSSPSCTSNINSICPPELQVKNSSGQVMGCYSACKAGLQPNDQYCCAGKYNCSPHSSTCSPGTLPCDPTKWPKNYAGIFKQACPTAYSYPYDDPSSTFTCTDGKYEVVFCG